MALRCTSLSQPPDIEEVHWANFDATMQGRVREAVEKIFQREKPLNAETLQEELDMGPKEVRCACVGR